MVSQISHSRTSRTRPVVGVLTCPNTSLVSPGPTPNFNLPILPISLCLSPGKLSESSLVQTPHLCLQDLLPTSACRDILNAHLQASCRSFHLSKHLTCVSRTYSQLQPVEILQAFQKHVVSGNQLTSHIFQMTLQPTCHKKWSETQAHHLNPEYSSSSIPWLYISKVPTHGRLQILSTSSTQISRKSRSSIQTIPASP